MATYCMEAILRCQLKDAAVGFSKLIINLLALRGYGGLVVLGVFLQYG